MPTMTKMETKMKTKMEMKMAMAKMSKMIMGGRPSWDCNCLKHLVMMMMKMRRMKTEMKMAGIPGDQVGIVAV